MDDFQRQQSNINFWQGEAFSKSNELEEKSREAHEAKMGQIDAEKKAQAAIDEARQYESETDYLVYLGEKLLIKLNNTEDTLSKTQQKLDTVQKENDALKELLANWMVSQRAFKETAIDYGMALGKTKDEIVQFVLTDVKKKVLYDQTIYENNASDMENVRPYIQILKNKMK